jgi:hypothetical protein
MSSIIRRLRWHRHIAASRRPPCGRCVLEVPQPFVTTKNRPLNAGSRVVQCQVGSLFSRYRQYSTTTLATQEENANAQPPPPLGGLSSSIHDPSPSFKVAKVSYSGETETVDLTITQLLKSASIYARDLFTLNLTSRQERRQSRMRPVRRALSAIVPRDSVMILSFGNVRAVAGLEHVFLLDAHNPSVRDFANELAAIYSSGQLEGEPFELVFLEHVLKDTVDSFYRRLRLYEPIVDSFLDKVANEVYSDTGVHQLVPLKDSLQSFEIQVKQSLDCLTGLLNNDDEMLSLLLTEQAAASKAGSQIEFARHQHVELLLGVYARQISNVSMEISYSLGRLQSKQEFVALALAGYRNRMVRMNLHLGIAGLSFAMGTTVAGFFGMNLVTGLEDSAFAFYYVIFGSGMGGLVVAGTTLNFLSGSAMQKRASQRQEEIETLTNALSDIAAVDFTLKSTIERGVAIDKDKFSEALKEARISKQASQKEVDFLFEVFDRANDGFLASDDFYPEKGGAKKPS